LKTRVLQIYKVFYPDEYGGIPYVMDEIRRLSLEEFEHRILVCSDKDTTPSIEIDRVHSFGDLFSLPISPGYVFKLFKALKNVDVAVLHAPFPFGDLVFGLGLRRNVRLIVFWHSEILRQRWLALLLRPLFFRTLCRADEIIVSHQALIASSRSLRRFRNKVSVATFPINSSKYELGLRDHDRVNELRLLYESRLVVACGRLVRYKGFDVLIEAAKQLDAQVVIIGEGRERYALQQKIRMLDLTGRVHILGVLPHRDLVCYLHAANVFVLPSLDSSETFGIVQLEAMMCGCPVVNTALPTAVPEVARDGIEGITVAPGNPYQLADAIRVILNNPDIGRRLGSAGAARARETFAQDKFRNAFRKALVAKTEIE
jgi:glycosyltransferase involved in cell wall biosynthesis